MCCVDSLFCFLRYIRGFSNVSYASEDHLLDSINKKKAMDISASSDNALHRPPSEGRCVSRRPYVQERSSQHSRGPSSCDPTESPDETGQTARSSVAHAWIGLAGHQFLNSRATDLVRTHPRRGCDHADRITAGGCIAPVAKTPSPPTPPPPGGIATCHARAYTPQLFHIASRHVR